MTQAADLQIAGTSACRPPSATAPRGGGPGIHHRPAAHRRLADPHLRAGRDPADPALRWDRHGLRPGVGQAGVHHQSRRAAQHQPEPEQAARRRLGVRTGGAAHRRRQAVDPAVPRQEHHRLRAHRRRGDHARDGLWPEGHRVRHARTDDADHAQRDPAGGIRRRRRGVAAPARTAPEVGHPRLEARAGPHPSLAPGRWGPWKRLADYRRT